MKTIMIIDDDIHIGNMLEEFLIREGYLVLRAYSGTEALMLMGGSISAELNGNILSIQLSFHQSTNLLQTSTETNL